MNDDRQGGEAATQTVRPFYFMVPFWGERYRNYFLDYCLASMLAPNNLGLLRAKDGHRFLIATTRADWQRIEHSPLMEKLRAHATPTLVEIDSPGTETDSGYTAAIWHQNVCQKKLVEIAFRDQAYGCLVFPDIIVSDGMVASFLRSVQAGHRVVLCAALRQTQESVLAELDSLGYLSADARPALTGQPVTIPPRAVADLAVRHLHWEVAAFEEGGANQPYIAPFRFWLIAGGQGIVLHCVLANPMFFDYGAIDTHDTGCLDHDTLENVYVARNFARCGGIHVVQDSDEFGILSLTPAAVGQRHLPAKRPDWAWFKKIDQRCSLRQSMAVYARRKRDTVRRDLFLSPIRWHGGDLDETWQREEQKIETLIDSAVGDYAQCASGSVGRDFPTFPSRDSKYLPIDIAICVFHEGLLLRLGFSARALAGDRREWARIRRRIGKIAAGCRMIFTRAMARMF